MTVSFSNKDALCIGDSVVEHFCRKSCVQEDDSISVDWIFLGVLASACNIAIILQSSFEWENEMMSQIHFLGNFNCSNNIISMTSTDTNR